MHFLLLVVRLAPFARPASRNTPMAGRLRRGRILCAWPCALRPWRRRLPTMTAMGVGCAGIAYSGPGPVPCALGAPTAPISSMRRGGAGVACYVPGPASLAPLLPTFVPMAVGCAGVAFYATSHAPRAWRRRLLEKLPLIVGCARVDCSRVALRTRIPAPAPAP